MVHTDHTPVTPLIGVVEPDADVREFIQSLLERAGYRCEGFVSAERFERSLATHHFDCVITDSDLPGIDGLELARRLRAQRVPVPVMLLTSDNGSDIEQAATAAKVVRVQKKPLGVKDFLQSVEQVAHGSIERAAAGNIADRVGYRRA